MVLGVTYGAKATDFDRRIRTVFTHKARMVRNGSRNHTA